MNEENENENDKNIKTNTNKIDTDTDTETEREIENHLNEIKENGVTPESLDVLKATVGRLRVMSLDDYDFEPVAVQTMLHASSGRSWLGSRRKAKADSFSSPAQHYQYQQRCCSLL
jgi:hypothetical protein